MNPFTVVRRGLDNGIIFSPQQYELFFLWFCPAGLLSPTMPFPPQGPQGPMGFGQPRPPLMGYGGMFSDCTFFIFHADSGNVFVNQTTTFVLILNPLCQQVDLLTPPTNTEEAEATMTTSADKVATWGSRATLGETTVRVIFILL